MRHEVLVEINWDAIGALGEILGALAVLSTLVYLATQVRRANELSRFNSSKDILNQFNDINRMVTSDSELRRVLMKQDEISADEREQIYNFAMMFCAVWMSAQIAYDNDQIEEEFYEACKEDVLVEVVRWPNFRSGAEQWLRNYPQNSSMDIFESIVKTVAKKGDA
jgi:hypothetical protein